MLDFTPTEQQILQMLLAGAHPTLETLRRQFDQCTVAERKFTGVGFFTSFDVPDFAPRLISRKRIVIGDVCADVEGLKYGCGLILFVEEGQMSTLECHLWGDDAFPENPRWNRLYYVRRRKTREIEQPTKLEENSNIEETKERDMNDLAARFSD